MNDSLPIPGFNGYRAGIDGSIWSSHARSGEWKILKGEPRKEDGRFRLTLLANSGKYVRRYRSHFVLLAFVGPRPSEKHEALHKDGNCLNDAPWNLRWGTSLENKQDMIAHGTRLNGERVHTAKLTATDVLEIRRIGLPLKQHAEKHGVTESLICAILKRKAWMHV